MYKTASYTFIRPMLTGAILAGASAENKNLVKLQVIIGYWIYCYGIGIR